VVAVVLGFFVVAGNSPVRAQGKGHGNGDGHEKQEEKAERGGHGRSKHYERWTITRLAGGTWSIVAICRLD
jgi:hypothetical protein